MTPPAPSSDTILDGPRRLPMEVLEVDVRGYTVRVAAPHDLAPGRRVELVIGPNPPVPATVDRVDDAQVRVRRGTDA